MNQKAMFKITYGLYLASVKTEDTQNACIINTVAQIANNPTRVAISINKDNYTNDLVMMTKKLLVSALSTKTPLDIFKHFGFQSGRTVDKFNGIDYETVDGMPYLPTYCLSYLVCQVVDTIDLGSHSLFIAEIVDGEVLNDEDPITYAYYQSHVKPKSSTPVKHGYRCTVCNYIYEGDVLPDDFICPLCKHGAEDFEKL